MSRLPFGGSWRSPHTHQHHPMSEECCDHREDPDFGQRNVRVVGLLDPTTHPQAAEKSFPVPPRATPHPAPAPPPHQSSSTTTNATRPLPTWRTHHLTASRYRCRKSGRSAPRTVIAPTVFATLTQIQEPLPWVVLGLLASGTIPGAVRFGERGVDELVLLAHRGSWATYAAAFLRNSFSNFTSRYVRSSSRSRARSPTSRPGSSPTCSRR